MSCRKLGKELEIWLGQGQCGAWGGGEEEEGGMKGERSAITSLCRESQGSTQHVTIHSCFQARYYYRLCNNTDKKAMIPNFYLNLINKMGQHYFDIQYLFYIVTYHITPYNKKKKKIADSLWLHTVCPRQWPVLYSNFVCPRSSDSFYIVSYNIKWITTSRTYNTVFLKSIAPFYILTYHIKWIKFLWHTIPILYSDLPFEMG